MSEEQLERVREKNAEEISRLDQIEFELRNKLVILDCPLSVAHRSY